MTLRNLLALVCAALLLSACASPNISPGVHHIGDTSGEFSRTIVSLVAGEPTERGDQVVAIVSTVEATDSGHPVSTSVSSQVIKGPATEIREMIGGLLRAGVGGAAAGVGAALTTK